ncbi:MAG: methyltransferase domain-containing protein [Anaerolineales bacterium]|nr:methyltransferase domain-containing protein [Anaerolineales bacterium]
MIAAKEFSSATVERAYSRRSWIYSQTMARVEWSYHLTALEQAAVRPGEQVLEVAVGPGLTLTELAARVGPGTVVHGVDLAAGMLKLAAERLRAHGVSNFDLRQADSRTLPFEAGAFDLVYNAYMLDLIPAREMPGILAEFRRVLKPGGRLVLLNMSKPDEAPTPREWLYQHLPAPLVLYVMGACRPVLMEAPVKAAGFEAVHRTFLGGRAPSEIVLARRPAA